MTEDYFLDISGIGRNTDHLNSEVFPIFEGMSPVHLRILNAAAKAMMFSKGVQILHEGDAPHDMYFIHTGKVAITRQIDGVPKALAYLSAGEIYGEFGALRKKARYASVYTVETTRIIRVQLNAIEQVFHADKSFYNRVNQMLKERMLDSFFFNHKCFAGISTEARIMLSIRIETQCFKRNDVLCQQGHKPDDISLIVSGEVEISYSKPMGETMVLEVRRDGGIIGELSVNNGRSLAYSALAVSDTDVVILDSEAMKIIQHAYPAGYKFLQQHISRSASISASRIKDAIKFL
ncbi:MAG: cyclic nucleotide-binding domain-containing protein [Mariprofundales bacterium]